MMIAVTTGLPSRYAIGQEVYFHPNMFEVTPDSTHKAFPAKVMKVQFTGSKVTYDLALLTADGDGSGEVSYSYYEAITVKDVDSTFVASYDDICLSHARELARIAKHDGYTLAEKLERLKARRSGMTIEEVRNLAAENFYKGLDALRVQYKEDTDGCA